MKRLLLLVFSSIVIPFNAHSQEIPNLRLTQNGVSPIVVEAQNYSASDLYNKSLNWIKETYKSPETVLKADIVNEKIRLDGYVKDAWWYKSLGVELHYDMEYTVEISFKDGRYRFEYVVGDSYTDNGVRILFNYKTWYNKDGELKKSFVPALSSIEKTMNSLSQSFYDYVTGETLSKDNDWE